MEGRSHIGLPFFIHLFPNPVSSFEASTGPNIDSTATIATFVVAVDQYRSVDSLAFVVTSANGETAYAAGNALEGWIADVPFRIEGNTLYLTIESAAIGGTAPYSTEARLRDNAGNMLTYTR